jgi:23S rRNA (cytidine1920-2'-O)/16S rRNA (cytidine1409-2'-O)-methyltransferase
MRADQLIVARGLAPTRSAAQRLIARRGVRWLAPGGWALPRKAGEELPDDCALDVTDDAELRYVSRGGLKLAGALDRSGVSAEGRVALDLGQSTGGFTDVLLQRGASRVVGVDVGHGQLHPRLAADGRVALLEGVNARSIDVARLAPHAPPGGFDLVVADLSFISLTLVLPTVARWLAPSGDALLLVKPQFELQPADIGKGGIVRDAAGAVRVEARIRNGAAEAGLLVRDWFESPITGGDGNREFFVRAQHAPGKIR